MNTPFTQIPRFTLLGDSTLHLLDEDERPAPERVMVRLVDIERYLSDVQTLRNEAASAIMRLGTFLDK